MFLFDYLFYRMYTAELKSVNYSGDFDSKIMPFFAVGFVVSLLFSGLCFMICGIFSVGNLPDIYLKVMFGFCIVFYVLFAVYYFDKTRTKKIVARCKDWEKKHQDIESIPSSVLYLIYAIVSLSYAVLAGAYFNGDILPLWRF